MSKNKELKVLSDLVEQSDVKYTVIVLYLANAGLLEQYYEELELRKQYKLKPTITEEEFNRIISGEQKQEKQEKKAKKDNKKE